MSSIESLRVVSRCGCGCDSVDFAEHDPAHRSRIIADGLGTAPAGGKVGVLVWATQDAITRLEIYDMGAGDNDTKLPVPDSVHGWEPQNT